MILIRKHEQPQNLVLIGVQKSEKKNTIEAFYAHTIHMWWTMHEHVKNLPKYMFRMPQGANIQSK